MLCKLLPIQKQIGNKFVTVMKMVKVNPGSSFEEIDSTLVPDAVYQVSRSSASWFPKKIFLSFLQYMGMVMWPGTFEQIFTQAP